MATRRPRSGVLHVGRGRAAPRPLAQLGTCFAAAVLLFASVAVAPVASADATDSLRAAIPAARGTACGPIRTDPVIDQAAKEIGDTTDSYLNFAARAVPASDALPILKDLGYGGSTAKILTGSATSAGDSIKGLLLQGFAVLPDCSYTAYGVATTYNAKKDVVIATAVLVG
jgi:hypothetical protein